MVDAKQVEDPCCRTHQRPAETDCWEALPTIAAQVTMGFVVALGLTKTEQLPGFPDRHRGTATRVRKIHEPPPFRPAGVCRCDPVQWPVLDAAEPRLLLVVLGLAHHSSKPGSSGPMA